MQNSVPPPEIQYASAKHRLLSIVYDGLLLGAVLFIAMAIFIPIANSAGLESGHPVYSVYFLLVCFLFYAGFWTHGGQTLGMKTWKMRLQQNNGDAITWPLALVRFITAIFSWSAAGAGFVWSLFSPQKRTWHDFASKSVLIDLRQAE